jgi:hypothetical protein
MSDNVCEGDKRTIFILGTRLPSPVRYEDDSKKSQSLN